MQRVTAPLGCSRTLSASAFPLRAKPSLTPRLYGPLPIASGGAENGVKQFSDSNIPDTDEPVFLTLLRRKIR